MTRLMDLQEVLKPVYGKKKKMKLREAKKKCKKGK